MSNTWNSGSADILQAITEHPDYPIYFLVDGEEICDPREVPYTVHISHRVDIGKITKLDDVYFADDDELRDAIECEIWDDSLSAGENERTIDRILESKRWEPCILIVTGA